MATGPGGGGGGSGVSVPGVSALCVSLCELRGRCRRHGGAYADQLWRCSVSMCVREPRG